MRITESKLRSIIRSVIRESYGTDFRGVKARQTREYQNHPNRAADAKERKALRDKAEQFVYNVDRAVAALIDYHDDPEMQTQTKGMSSGDIENLISRAEGSTQDQTDLVHILGYDIYKRYIGNSDFWQKVKYGFEDIIFSG